MFDELFIASTAVSSFNNAALLNPFFFATGLLSLPVLIIVFLYGRDFVSKFGWTNQNAESKTGFWSAVALVIYIVLFGGNYAVIRGGISLLPVLLAIVLFVLTIVISNNLVRFKYINKLRDKKLGWLILFVFLMCALTSGTMTWWGMLLQFSAVICGMIVGCRMFKGHSWLVLTTLIYSTVIILVLMQPEYFRFGQLGHLTLIHLMALVVSSVFIVVTMASRYFKARGKIRHNAYVKLKWLFRIMTVLTVILFISTESVPVFLGLLCSMFCLVALNIYHSTKVADNLCKQSWAWLIICLGILLVCPVISAVGVIYLSFFDKKIKMAEFLRLL